jgi:hypothetical protein
MTNNNDEALQERLKKLMEENERNDNIHIPDEAELIQRLTSLKQLTAKVRRSSHASYHHLTII